MIKRKASNRKQSKLQFVYLWTYTAWAYYLYSNSPCPHLYPNKSGYNNTLSTALNVYNSAVKIVPFNVNGNLLQYCEYKKYIKINTFCCINKINFKFFFHALVNDLVYLMLGQNIELQNVELQNCQSLLVLMNKCQMNNVEN